MRRVKSLSDLSTCVYDPTLFKVQNKKYSGAVVLDLYCFLKRNYQHSSDFMHTRCDLTYISLIYDQLKRILPDTVAICVFDVPTAETDDAEVKEKIVPCIKEKKIDYFFSEMCSDIPDQVKKYYRFSQEKIYFITPLIERYDELRYITSDFLLPGCLQGNHHKEEFRSLMEVITSRAIEITLALDIDDTVLCTGRSLYERRTCLNDNIFLAVRILNQFATISEIVFFTAREAPNGKECESIESMSDDMLADLEPVCPIDVNFVAHYFNKRLVELDISHQVKRVLYSNARYADVRVDRKANLIRLCEQDDDWNFVLLDNSINEINAVKDILPKYPKLLPPISVHEDSYLSQRDLQKLQAAFPRVFIVQEYGSGSEQTADDWEFDRTRSMSV